MRRTSGGIGKKEDSIKARKNSAKAPHLELDQLKTQL